MRTAPLGRILQEGALAVIVGEPNVGKSSLLNALLREDRAIVAPTPGTTRDWIEAPCSVRGLPLRLVDTAGPRDWPTRWKSRDTGGRGRCCRRRSFCCASVEAHLPYRPAKFDPPENVPIVLIANKSDLGRHESLPDNAILLSALTGAGLDNLETRIEVGTAGRGDGRDGNRADDQRAAKRDAERAAQALDHAREALREIRGLEVVSLELREALAILRK